MQQKENRQQDADKFNTDSEQTNEFQQSKNLTKTSEEQNLNKSEKNLTASNVAVSGQKAPPKKKSDIFINILLIVAVVALIAMIVVKIFFFENFTVDGDSMLPNFHDGQVVWVAKQASPNLSDVVVFEIEGQKVGVAQQTTKLIKRVVALEGDTVWSENGILHRIRCGSDNEEVLTEEKYGDTALDKMARDVPITKVKAGEVFVLGDNRNRSNDSRYFGAIKLADIVGIVL